jgi:hypothetical protein
MNIVSKNIFGSGAPSGIVTAYNSIEYIDIAARTKWKQVTVPYGNTWTMIANNVTVTTDYLAQGQYNLYEDGHGVPAGGTTGQALTKVSDADYDTHWSAASGFITALANTDTVTLTETTGTLTADVRMQNSVTIILSSDASGVKAEFASMLISQFTNDVPYLTAVTGYVPDSRTLSINGTSYDLSADRSWNVGTVTIVAMTVPTGLSISGSPVTTSGTFAVTLTSGYVIPTTTEETNWNTAYTNRITSLTTTGTSGAATLSSNTLNIPQYQAAGTYVTSLTVVTSQGVSGSFSAGATPALTLTLGALTGVTSFNGLVVTANTGVITTGTWNGALVTGTYGGTGVNNGSSTITVGGNLAYSGAFATTVTVTGTTTVTLPTSGTLYGTATGSITSAQLATSLTDETGSGVAVFGTSPTFTTDITTPLVIGGTAVGSQLKLKGTTANGTTSTQAVQIIVGSNGNIVALSAINNGSIGIMMGASVPNAYLQLGAGTTSIAPLRLTSGTNRTTAAAGDFEYNGTNLFFTRTGTTRENVLVAVDNATAPATSIGAAVVNYYGSAATNFLGDPNRWMSINILGTVYKVPLYT